jgi:biopolymer transport protein ExbD
MRSRGLRNIVIELTSLLDVVMILIFAVMINYSNVTAKTEEDYKQTAEELEALTAEHESTLAELELAQTQLAEGNVESMLRDMAAANSRQNAYAYMDDMIVIVNVTLENYSDNKYRVLSYGVGSVLGLSSGPVARDDATTFEQEINRMEDFLYTQIYNSDPDTPVFIVFSYDGDNVYYDDCNKLIRLLSEKSTLREMVFFCENDLKEV